MIHLDAIYPTCLSNIHSVFKESSRFCFTMLTLCLGQGFNKKKWKYIILNWNKKPYHYKLGFEQPSSAVVVVI